MIQKLAIQKLRDVPRDDMTSSEFNNLPEFRCEVPECGNRYRSDSPALAWNLLDLHMRVKHPEVAAGNLGERDSTGDSTHVPGLGERDSIGDSTHVPGLGE